MTQAPAPLRLRTVAEMRAVVARWRAAGERIAFVPTMGALHEGHLALVREGKRRCERAIVSIFVNPTQFGPQEDFQSYPRDEAGDVAKLRAVGADAVFVPAVAEMYPEGATTTVTVGGVSEGLCGAFRPGHFAGVATVVTKLLLQSLADVALFGEKDYQQLQVIRRLARDLAIPVEIIGVPTVREADGLALSSRNAYLSAEERRVAPLLHETLRRIASAVEGGAPAEPALAEARRTLEEAGFGPVQYVELRDAETLAPALRPGRPGRVLAAAYIGRTRLIDNLPVAARR